MSKTDQPQEPEKTVFERDKTAKERQPAEDGPKAPIKPKPKIKKAFVASGEKHSHDFPGVCKNDLGNSCRLPEGIGATGG